MSGRSRRAEISPEALAAHRSPASPPLPPLRARARAALSDEPLQSAMRSSSRLFRAGAMAAAANPELVELREVGERIRAEGVANLRANVEQLEESLSANGFVVHRAATGADARQLVTTIALDRGVKSVVKSKSMATEEAFVNDALEAAGIDVTETDLGEYIIQTAGERPAHIIAPAVHKSREEVARIFTRDAKRPIESDLSSLNDHARLTLREKFLAADMGLTGANFAAADTGTLAMVSNEGNLRMSTTLPRIHVALVPIEKTIARFSDLAVLLRLLVTSATGQPLTSYVSLLTSPRRPGEPDGPEESHVILLDSGRYDLVGTEYESMLRCIRCAACLNVCPVYRVIGGHSYGGAYSGPMGAVLGTLVEETAPSDLPFASTLCGACTEVCPVGIPLHELLYKLRADRRRTRRPATLAPAFSAWAFLWSSAAGYKVSLGLASTLARVAGRQVPPGIKTSEDGRWALDLPWSLKRITDERALPLPAPESFRSMWKRRRAQRPGNRPVEEPEAEPAVQLEGAISGGTPSRQRDEGLEQPDALKARLARNGFRVFDARGGEPLDEAAEWVLSHGGSVVVDRSQVTEGILAAIESREIGIEEPTLEIAADAEVGISPACCAIIETGSVVVRVDGETSRLPSLLPPAALLVIREKDVHKTMAEALECLATAQLPSACVIISGPSKTADIELTLSTGVHGPGKIAALLTE